MTHVNECHITLLIHRSSIFDNYLLFGLVVHYVSLLRIFLLGNHNTRYRYPPISDLMPSIWCTQRLMVNVPVGISIILEINLDLVIHLLADILTAEAS